MSKFHSRHRHTCTKGDPWDKGKSIYGDHPDADWINDYYNWPNGDNYDLFKCPNCGLQFKVILPDT